MAMTILNNPNTRMGLGELNKNITKQGISLRKIASGMRINGAGDDASGYSISESMRVRIRGLDQCQDNTDLGNNMLKVASGAVDVQVELMKKLREIALKASGDTYTQADRDVLQNETNQLLMQCNDIAWETNYNGIRLLDGVTDTMDQVVTREWVPSGTNDQQTDATSNTQGRSLLGARMATGLLGAPNDTVDLDPTEPPVYNQIQGIFPPNNKTKIWESGNIDGYTPYESIDWKSPMTTRQIMYTKGIPGRFDPPLYLKSSDLDVEVIYGGSGAFTPDPREVYYVKDGQGNFINVIKLRILKHRFTIWLRKKPLFFLTF